MQSTIFRRLFSSLRAKPIYATAEIIVPEYPSYVLHAPATEVSTLENGLRIASEGSHGETATVGVWIGAGSRYETIKNNGSAHFLEHMAFKGTSRRTQHQLEIEIENMGGHLNAYTSREQTVYYAKVFKKDIPKAMDILSDILQNSKLDPNAIDRERDVILREMEEVNKQYDEVVFDKLNEKAYYNQSLGRTILGPEENIKSLTRDDLKQYIATHYIAPRMVIAGAGAIDHQELVELSKMYFGNMPSVSTNGLAPPPLEPARFCGLHSATMDDSLPVAHIALAFESYSWTSEHSFPLLLIQNILGNWDRTSGAGSNMSSQLARIVAEKGLAHSYSTFNTCYQDTGLFGIYAKAEKGKLEDLIGYMMDALLCIVHKTTDEDVEHAKTQLKANMIMQLDGSSPVCEDIGRHMLTYGRRLTPAEIFSRIDVINADTVKHTANSIINSKDHALAAVGPIQGLPSQDFIRSRSYWPNE